MGLSWPIRQTYIFRSTPHDAKLHLVFQSTHKIAWEWNANSWMACPDAASQTIEVYNKQKQKTHENKQYIHTNCTFTASQLPLTMYFPFLFHFNANIGPWCCPKVFKYLEFLPSVFHTWAKPLSVPKAICVPSC